MEGSWEKCLEVEARVKKGLNQLAENFGQILGAIIEFKRREWYDYDLV